MDKDLKLELDQVFKEALLPPFSGGFKEWVEANIVLPPAYAIPGRLNLSISPYLIKPMEAIDDPRITQINLCMATQVGKSLVSELFIPYAIVNNPGPLMRIFQNAEVSDIFTETRLIPLLKNCDIIKPLLKYDRFSTKKSGITLPFMSVICGSSNTALQHGLSIKYLLCDELHQWDRGQFNKFLARTTAFSGRRKVICASQPARVGHEWEEVTYKGLVYEWQWLCPNCKTRQPFHWSKEKTDNKGYAGFNWDTVLLQDGSTNIAESSKTTWLECINPECNHKLHDTPTNRTILNQTGEYVCIKRDGDPSVVSYMAPCFVNPNISFASKAAEYMVAKRTKKLTGLDELMEIFVTQGLGKFYKKDDQQELSKILVELYDKNTPSSDWVLSMGVDVQRSGKIKYYVVRAWNKNGNESKRVAFGIARTWEEIEAIRVKHGILFPMVHCDSGDGVTVTEVYQECVKHGQTYGTKGNLKWACYTPTKGDGNKTSYKHTETGITKLYSPESPQDAQFPVGHKLKGIPAPLVLFSNFSIKTILASLRDNKIEGIKWMIDSPDEVYDSQMYSEGLVEVIDKKSGLKVERWLQHKEDNHFFDVECLCLLGALRANVFSPTTVKDEYIKKLIDNSTKKE